MVVCACKVCEDACVCVCEREREREREGEGGGIPLFTMT